MNIPESITCCAVEGDLLKVVLDSRDSGSVPNARQLRDLRATVTATVPYLSPPEGMFVMTPFVFETNQVGQIINPESPDDAPLIPATNQTHTPEFRYLVEVTSPDLAEPIRWRAAAPAGGVVSLSTVVDPPAPEDIPEWERTLAEVEAARAAVQALVVDAQGQAALAAVERAAAEAAADAAEAFRDEAGSIVSDGIIDDDAISTATVWSSDKTVAHVAAGLAMKADSSHTHAASDITSGTMSTARLPGATTALRGIVELATTAEASAGTDTARAVTPAGVAAAVVAKAPEVVQAAVGVPVDVPWLWGAGAQQLLTTPTHDGSGESTHPSALYFADGWNGYKYWMAHTPYPGGNEAHEDPNILASNDGVTWVVPAGLTNPLDDQSGTPNPHNSDTNLVMKDGTMHLVWRMVDRPNGNATRIFWRTSTNGTTWTAKREIFAPSHGFLSPSLAWTGSRWEMWGFDGSTLVRFHTTVALPGTSTVWTRTNCTVPLVGPVRRWWHGEVKRHAADLYTAVLVGYDSLGAARGGDLYMAVSTDGVNWVPSDTPLLPAAPAGESRYAATLVPISGTGTNMAFELYYGRVVWTGTTSAWRILRAPVTTPSTLGGIAIRARQPVGEREWTPANVDPSIDVSGLVCTVSGRDVRVRGVVKRSAAAVVASNFKAFSLPNDGLKPAQELRFPVGYGAEVGKVRVAPASDPLWFLFFSHDNANIAASVSFYLDIGWRI